MLSIIIPAWNEGGVIARTLLAAVAQPGEPEVIVVDAGSTDSTIRLAEELSLTLIRSPRRQRAAQMNLGATDARGDILLFLHADTVLPAEAASAIASALQDQRIVGGAFRRRFETGSLFLRGTALLTRLRNFALGWHLGDQGIFVRRDIFERLHGFADFDRFEDLDFSRRMARLGKVVTLAPPVLTSARRFDRLGPVRQTTRDFLLTMRYLTGSRAALFHGTGSAPGPTPTHVPEQPS